MTYSLAIFFILLCLCNKKSKSVFWLFILFMWILFGWSYKNADTNIYINRFYNYSGNIQEITEPIFTRMMQLFNNLNFSYQQFLIIISFIILLLYGIVIIKLTKNINFVLLLYFIFPFSIEVVQVRYTMATVLIMIGYYYLLKEDNKKAIVKYIAIVLIASCIHYASIFCIIMILPKIFTKNKIIFYAISGTIIMSIVFSGTLLINIPGNSTLVNKVNAVLAGARRNYTSRTMINTEIRIITFFITYYIANLMVKRRLKANYIQNKQQLEINETVLKMNIIVLLILPIVIYSVDIYRIQQTLCIVNYITMSYYLKDVQKRGKVNKYNILFYLYTSFITFINLYLLILRNNNINTVFLPLFENNLIL